MAISHDQSSFQFLETVGRNNSMKVHDMAPWQGKRDASFSPIRLEVEEIDEDLSEFCSDGFHSIYSHALE